MNLVKLLHVNISEGKSREKSRGMRGVNSLLICAVCLLSGNPATASPVLVFECEVFQTIAPTPIFSIEPKYTFRRHVIETVPTDEFIMDTWAQGRFADNGEFEIGVYPSAGGFETENATNLRTFILDGKVEVRDTIYDEGQNTEEQLTFEEFKIDNVNVQFTGLDDTILDNHLDYPESFDLDEYEQKECLVYWRAPAPVPCGGVGTLCEIGSHKGLITSVSYEDHDEDHGNTFLINAGLNDAWVNTDAPFQGMFITVFPDLGLIFVAWFTFDSVPPDPQTMATFGSPDQRWVTAAGSFSGSSANLNAELTTGGVFNASEPLPTQDTNYGTINIEFLGCKDAIVTFDFPSAQESGEFNIGRVLEENAALCEALKSE